MDRIERCKETYAKLFGGQPVDSEGTDPEFMHILQRLIFGEIFYLGELDDQTHELITITILTGNQTLPQLKGHVGAALRIGIEPLTIRETIYQAAPFIGFPKTLNAIVILNEVFMEKGIPLPLQAKTEIAEEDRFPEGTAIQWSIYGDTIKNRYKDLPGEFGEAIPRILTEFGFGDFYTREGLNVKTRELLIFCLLASLGGVDMQVKSHAVGAMKSGNNRLELIAALLQAMPYMGFPRMFNALNILQDTDFESKE